MKGKNIILHKVQRRSQWFPVDKCTMQIKVAAVISHLNVQGQGWIINVHETRRQFHNQTIKSFKFTFELSGKMAENVL